jgi:hypothetical protein
MCGSVWQTGQSGNWEGQWFSTPWSLALHMRLHGIRQVGADVKGGRMARVLLVIAIALSVGVLCYGVAHMRSGEQRVQESVENLDELVANSPEQELTHAWYEEPINVGFAGATITLAFGGFALMLEHARSEEFS